MTTSEPELIGFSPRPDDPATRKVRQAIVHLNKLIHEMKTTASSQDQWDNTIRSLEYTVYFLGERV